MKLTPNNFLQNIKNLVTGGGWTAGGQLNNDAGFLRDVDYTPDLNLWTGSTISSTAKVFYPIMIPRDYDENSDVCQLHLLGSTSTTPAGTTLAGGILTFQNKLVSTLGPGSTTGGGVFASATNSTSIALPTASTVFAFTLDLSRLGLTRDNVFGVSTVATGQVGSIVIIGGFLTYASCLVAYKDSMPPAPVWDTVNQANQPIRG